MDIVCTVDKNYVMACGVMIYSLCKNNYNENITFHIVGDEGVTEQSYSQVDDIVNSFPNKAIAFYHINGSGMENYPNLKNNYLSKAAYYRLYLPGILPDTLDKVLYLDCDIIVRHSLTDLWDIDVSDCALAATTDSYESYNIEFYNRLQYSPDLGYFNSGVMLINMKYWRDHNLMQSFIDYLRDHSDRVLLHDQDILNVITKHTKKEFPIKYNFQDGFLLKKPLVYMGKYGSQIEEAKSDPVILHFVVYKPWFKGCNHPYKDEFFRYRDKTVWANMPLTQRPVKIPPKERVKKQVKQVLRWMKIVKPLPNKYLDDLKLKGQQS